MVGKMWVFMAHMEQYARGVHGGTLRNAANGRFANVEAEGAIFTFYSGIFTR